MRHTPQHREKIRKYRLDNIDGIIFAVGVFGMAISVLYLLASAFR